MKMRREMLGVAAILIGVSTAAQAQVPPPIAKELVAIGRGVCPPETAKVYLPLHAGPPVPRRRHRP